MAELSTRSMINDERWAFVNPLLPLRRHRPPLNGRMDTRRAFAAVVYAVTTDTPWHQVPNAFGGVRPSTVQRRFWSWTDADVWRQLAAAAVGTPHERWAHIVADAAIGRAGRRAGGYTHPEPVPPDDPAVVEPAAEPLPRRYPRYSSDEYAVAREALNRHHGI